MKTLNRLIQIVVITLMLVACSGNQASTDKNKGSDVSVTAKQCSTSQTEEAVSVAGAKRQGSQHQAINQNKQKGAGSARDYAVVPGQSAGIIRHPRPFMLTEQSNENYADTQGKLNPVFSTLNNPVSTFSIDVDTASYSNVRRLLEQGRWPMKGAVRVEEMINYFNYSYSAPQSDEQRFKVHSEVAPSPWNSATHLLRIGLKGYQVSKDNLPPMNLVFLLDVSGSMANANKLPLLKQAFSLLTRQLRPQDHVAIVVYAGASGLVLKPTAGDKQDEILDALQKLNAGGSTNGGAGIELAYQTARSHFNKGGINRVTSPPMATLMWEPQT